MAFHTRKMYVAMMVSGVVTLAYTVLLTAGPVVDKVQQTSLGEQRQRTENGGLVDGIEHVLHIGKRESIVHPLTYRTPNQATQGGKPDACRRKFLVIDL